MSSEAVMESGSKKRILVVDDDKSFLDTIVKRLSERYPKGEFLRASSGDEAIRMIEENPIDLMISDIYMPGMNGFDLLFKVKQDNPKIGVIMMTGYSTPELHREAFQKGSLGYIEKPFKLDDMLSLIESAFEKKTGSFRGEVEGIQISDIVQINCLARVNNAILLSCEGKNGAIYFKGGEVVHAQCDGIEGEEALGEMLNWEGGSFSSQKNPSFPKRTIFRKWEQLLMEKIISIDESRKGDFVMEKDITIESDGQKSITNRGNIKVLVVDDSRIISKGISEILSNDPDLEVVGEAEDGRDALVKLAQLKPDVVTLDVNMPEMDGLTALKHIMIMQPTPVVMLSAYTQEGAKTTFDSLRFGAVDFISKPSSRQDMNLEVQKKTIIEKVKRAAMVRLASVQHIRVTKGKDRNSSPAKLENATFVVAIGAALGGFGSLLKILSRLPSDLKAAVLIVQYMPNEVVGPFSEYLNQFSDIKIKSAEDGEIIKNGVCYITSDSNYMTVLREGEKSRLRLHDRPFDFEHQNSFNILLISLAETYGKRSLGVVLTGEHSDGLEGISELKRVGGLVFAQEIDTCLSPEMPKMIIEEGLADEVYPDTEMARAISGVLARF